MNFPDPRAFFALDRHAVVRAFDRASASYDAAAALQERVRNELVTRLDELKITPTAILDLGAGTGHGSRALKRRFPRSQVVAADIAPGMLERAKRQSRWLRRFARVRADAYSLPFRDDTFDLVFSSLMLQWCDDLDAVFAEIARVLRPGGLLLFSTFGPGTLAELREAWNASGDASNHVNHFFDAHALGSALMHAGLGEPVLDVDRIVVGYPDAMTLMRELKAIGAHNVTRGRARGLTGRARLNAMTTAYESLRRDGQLPATWEVIHASAWGTARADTGKCRFSARDADQPERDQKKGTDLKSEDGTDQRSVPGYFITGTDTGVGKTLVAVMLTRALAAQGTRVAVMKPVAAGTVKTPEGEFNDDALELLAASNVKAAYEDVNPWLLKTPASPHLAARADGVAIRHDRIAAAFARLAAASDLVLVEGAGGWLAPISATETMADVAEKLGLPVILVVGLRLGCLNHALLTRDALSARGLGFAGWVANKLAEEMPFAIANIETLSSRFGVPPLAVVPVGQKGTDLRSVPGSVAENDWAIEAAKRLVSP